VTAGLLAAHFTGLPELLEANRDKFLAVEGIGEQTAVSLEAYFADPAVHDLIDRLQQAGLTFESPTRETRPLAGRVFLFTGTLVGLSRDEAKHVVKSLGGQVASSISQRVTDVVVGAKAGGKKKKAMELGLGLLSESAFLALIASVSSGRADGA
jgi:DNA ligase (NAD+)